MTVAQLLGGGTGENHKKSVQCDSSGVSHLVPGCDVLNCSAADVKVSHGAVNRLSSLPKGIIARSTAQSAVRMS
jgi:hypothetical protein